MHLFKQQWCSYLINDNKNIKNVIHNNLAVLVLTINNSDMAVTNFIKVLRGLGISNLTLFRDFLRAELSIQGFYRFRNMEFQTF